MNKLLSAGLAIGMLSAVGAAQAAEVLGDKQMDTITAGADVTMNLPASSIFALVNSTATTGTLSATGAITVVNAQGPAPGIAVAGHCNDACTITATNP